MAVLVGTQSLASCAEETYCRTAVVAMGVGKGSEQQRGDRRCNRCPLPNASAVVHPRDGLVSSTGSGIGTAEGSWNHGMGGGVAVVS